MRRAVLLAVVLSLSACSRPDDPGPAPARTAPWRATPTASVAARASRTVAFTIETRGRARFELPAREATPQGELRVARGRLTVDLLDLSKTRGTVELDVASITMLGDDAADAGVTAQRSQAAQAWLDVGADRPEAVRERLRWARFTILSIEQPSALAAHQGRVVRSPPEPRDAEPRAPEGGGADGGDAAPPSPAEIRAVDLTATGELELHGFRVRHDVRLRALFEYAARAEASAIPERLVIETRAPIVIPLQVHDIKPRNAAGVSLAEDAKLLGVQVGKSARVSLELAARPEIAR
ncbi:MAG: hypothetical protein OZ921_18640 [Sorangiineae bacterium]|nr:hypothetical protein [Polyangiaceae bacterium]MEB2324540.1 hypothetical protein [Sorangiineae bacterium]